MAITTIAPVVTENGVTAATYDEILAFLKDKYRAIYGHDIYLEADSMDGQFLGVMALEFANVGAACVQVYNSFNPKTALKDALTRNVKINGIKRSLSTFSTVDLLVSGTAGTAIQNGVAVDKNGYTWNLPALVTIPNEGRITASAIATQAGAILAQVGTINNIHTPTRGWLSVTNPTSSSIGQDTESDTKLRQRQALSTQNAASSQTDGLCGAILALENVTRCKAFENDSSTVDANGLPAKSVCIIVHGGDSKKIAELMASKKTMGCAWHGNTSVTILNAYQDAKVVKFYRPTVKQIGYQVRLSSTHSYSADTAQSIAIALASYTNALDIGDKITQNKIMGVANLHGAKVSKTYEVKSISLVSDGNVVNGDYILPFGCVAFCNVSQIAIEVTNG